LAHLAFSPLHNLPVQTGEGVGRDQGRIWQILRTKRVLKIGEKNKTKKTRKIITLRGSFLQSRVEENKTKKLHVIFLFVFRRPCWSRSPLHASVTYIRRLNAPWHVTGKLDISIVFRRNATAGARGCCGEACTAHLLHCVS